LQKLGLFFQSIRTVVHQTIGIEQATLDKILLTILLVLSYVALAAVVRRLMARYIVEAERRYVAAKTADYLLGVLAMVLMIRVWLGGVAGMMTYLGLLSAGVAVALKDPLTNVAGWLFILVRGPFHVGDRIEIAGSAGDVVDVRLFQFSIVEIGNWVHADQSTGRIIHLPNGLVFTAALANFTQGFNFIWNELEVVVTFESQWRDAKQILQEIADRNCVYDTKSAEAEVKRAAQKYLIHYRYLTPIIWTAVVDSGVKLTLRYLCDPRSRRSTEMKMWEDILDAFAGRDDIDFAYPTQRVYFNRAEGKSGAGGTGELRVKLDASPDEIKP
jgi:small-conductance mechanosensitive channel